MAVPPDRRKILHLIDLDEEIDPLAALVAGGDCAVVQGRFAHAGLRWRAAARLFRSPPRFVVAWGERAFAVARLGGVQHGIYRPSRGRRQQPPVPGWRAIASTRAEIQRLAQSGWSESDCFIVPPPGVDTLHHRVGRELTRRELGAAPDDFLWLLSGDAGGSGLRDAVWAGAIMHVMERDRQMHRILLWGSSRQQHDARKFADQLGLPPLPISARKCAFHDLAQRANAALLLPHDYDVWSAAVVAQAGIPAVINRSAAVQEVLGGRQNVRTTPGDRTRLIVREMLALVENQTGRIAGDECFAPQRVLEKWSEVVSAALSAASAAER